MNAARIDALANLLDDIRREQEAEGCEVFSLVPEDRISMHDAKEIVAALKARANAGTQNGK